jgi:transposase
LRERESVETLAKRYELHPNQISTWKKEATANMKHLFERGTVSPAQDDVSEKLYAQIGQLKVENDWLKKKLL